MTEVGAVKPLKDKPKLTEAQIVAGDVAHACASAKDTKKPHLVKPFGFEVAGVGWVAGTDGHRMALVRSEAWKTFERDDAPRAASYVASAGMAAGYQNLGTILADHLEPARKFPVSFHVQAFLEGTSCSVDVEHKVDRISGTKTTKIFRHVPVEWIRLDQTPGGKACSMMLHYIVDAVDFIGTTVVTVWGCKEDALAPFYFTGPGHKSPLYAHRIAIVMPVRI